MKEPEIKDVNYVDRRIVSDHYDSKFNHGERIKKDLPINLFLGGVLVWFFDSVQVILIAVAIFIVFHVFIASPHTIEGPSMEPNFCQGDLVLADKITPRLNNYQYGDVIIFKHDEENDYIKRIIGVPGDKIRIEGGFVYRNDQKLEENYLSPENRKTDLFAGSRMKEGFDYTVPENRFFVLGDNRPRSVDSRSFLFINPDVNTIKGRITALIWPAKDARIFDKNGLMPLDSCRR